MVHPFGWDGFYPTYDDGRGECYAIHWYGAIPCAGSVELRDMPGAVFPCCEAHFDEVWDEYWSRNS